MRTSAFLRNTRPLLVVAFLAVVGLLVLVAAAQGARPGWYSPPQIVQGQAVVGSTLAGSDGSLACDPKCEPREQDGDPNRAGVYFQWLLCNDKHGGGKAAPPGGLPDEGGPCPGAVIVKSKVNILKDSRANYYTVRPEDAGKYIQMEVIAVVYDCGYPRSDGSQECNWVEAHAWSPTFGPIAGSLPPPPPPPPPPAVAPTYTALPAIRGEFEDMQTLSVSNGTWNGTAPLSYTYQWLRCSKANAGCKPIEGATTAQYTATSADVATRLTAQVTVKNAGGQFVAVAPLTPKIAGAKPRPGHDSLQVSQLLPRQKLKVQSVAFTPLRLRRGKAWTATVTITDVRGFLIQGVEVDVADELGDVTSPTVLTNARGVATLKLKTTRFVPLGRLVLTVTATKPVDENAVESQAVTKRVVVTVSR